MHRDIKPGNIMINLDEKNNIIDLQISNFEFATRFKKGHKLSEIKTTMGFESPEMLRQSYDLKAESWSLGITIYYVVT